MSVRIPGPGLQMPENYGVIAKCPWCTEVDIRRRSKTQVTCGRINCQRKQNKYRRDLRDRRTR